MQNFPYTTSWNFLVIGIHLQPCFDMMQTHEWVNHIMHLPYPYPARLKPTPIMDLHLL
jgi:hypothetical protein